MAEAAASWLGEFHRYAATLVGRPQAAFLRRRDSRFYENHWRRFAANIHGHGHSPSWLDAFGKRFHVALGMLDAAPLTIIHGEFYPQNILRHADRIFPVDWETAAVGLGETDLVTLVDGWHKVRDRCISAYSQARGLDESSDDLMRRVALAQILISVYWLSYSDHSADDPNKLGRISRHLTLMHQAAGQLGLL
jgi:aminoglycoside phosphotransferase (APT) family kinase protein